MVEIRYFPNVPKPWKVYRDGVCIAEFASKQQAETFLDQLQRGK